MGIIEIASRPTVEQSLHRDRAIVDLLKAGWTAHEIAAVLRITERTYFRRLRKLRRLRDAAGPDADDPRDD